MCVEYIPDRRKTAMKLRANRNGFGYLTSYNVLIGSAEARRAGFIDEDGKPRELEKIVDEERREIVIRIKTDGDKRDHA